MPPKRTDKKWKVGELKSINGKEISPSQFIAEQMCLRRAERMHLKLKDGFWFQPQWTTFFRRQVTLVNRLLNIFDAQVVLNTVQKHYQIYSVLHPQLPNFCSEEQARMQAVKEKEQKILEEGEQNTQPSNTLASTFRNKSGKTKLEDLD